MNESSSQQDSLMFFYTRREKASIFMEHLRVFFFFLFLMYVPFQALAQTDPATFGPIFRCLNKGNYTSNSTFSTNLNLLVSSISSLKTNPYGFYNLTSSNESFEERAYGIGLCRREVQPDDCLNCIQKTATMLTEQCENTKQATVWSTHCMFDYSNRTIYGRVETQPTWFLSRGVEISRDRDEFELLQRDLLNRLKGIAASGGVNRKYAQGNGSASSGFERFFGSAQCTPDLSEQDCNDCLQFGFETIKNCCDSQIGLRWFCPSCNFRFETVQFYELEADLEPDPPAIQPSASPTLVAKTGKGKSESRVIIAIVIPIVLVTFFAICLYLVLKWKKKKRVKVLANSPLLGTIAKDDLSSTESLLVKFETLKVATNNFSSNNELGRGGFGSVYKGVFSNGQEIAVKRLSGGSGQGDIKFNNEILLLAKLQHRNLVRLLGFCIHREERLLVYEFIKNASLDHFIFDVEKCQLLNWTVRYKMIGGVTRGLLYLHVDSRFRIIHRDLKASNILLDEDMNPKIADFGLAKLFDAGAQTMTHRFTNRIAGTYGYMAPKYAMHGQFSMKTDVFSYGVLVIEIITGRKNNNGGSNDDEYVETLLSWVWRSWREDVILNVIDPSLTTESRNEILRCIHIGLLCVQENASTRPTMAWVNLMLSNHSLTLPTPSKPAFVLENVIVPTYVSSLNDVSISELFPR